MGIDRGLYLLGANFSSAAPAATQVRLLQSVVIGIMQKMHVMRLARAMHLCAVLAQDTLHHVPAAGKFHQMDGIKTNKARVKGHQLGLKN